MFFRVSPNFSGAGGTTCPKVGWVWGTALQPNGTKWTRCQKDTQKRTLSRNSRVVAITFSRNEFKHALGPKGGTSIWSQKFRDQVIYNLVGAKVKARVRTQYFFLRTLSGQRTLVKMFKAGDTLGT